MSYPYAYGVAGLELTFILVAIMLLHRLKPVLGAGPFYLAVATTLVFGQWVSATGIHIDAAFPGLTIAIGPAIFFTPLMAALLITYVVDGTVEIGRMILGIMAVAGLFIYLSYQSEKQCLLQGYDLFFDVPNNMARGLFAASQNFMLAALLSLLIEFLILPIIYELIRSWRFNVGISVTGAFLCAQVIDTFFYELVTNYPSDQWWDGVRHSYLARAAAALWVAAITTIYLKQRHIKQGYQSDARRPLDIIVGLVGNYGQSKRLQANVREWEGRYRMVVENTNDLIFLVDQAGVILDANKRSIRRSGHSIESLSDMTIQRLMRTTDGESLDWPAVWGSVIPNSSGSKAGAIFLGHEWVMAGPDGPVWLDVNISALTLRKSQAVLIAGRDITRRRELEEERQDLQEKLIHLERMDAVGKLAGGIAHDFNNLLHAIQGSLDMLDQISEQERAKKLIANISTATERASNLTGQLLGFGRRGKYQVTEISVEDLVRQTESLFRPMVGRNVQLKVAIHPDPMVIEGDFTQLEQVLLNLLINAWEGLLSNSGTIVLRAEPASSFSPGWEHDDRDDGREYVTIRVKDNGSGIDTQTMSRIFEPFFTTKEAKGTGMGLAMAYGCIENHHGWIHVESTTKTGTEFSIFLPLLRR